MLDRFNRQVNYLRLSVTQRCNLNCSYCGAAACHAPADELTPDEIYRLAKAFAGCGITKVRLTGGEPLLRQDITEIVKKVGSVDGIGDITATTNGILLTTPLAMELKAAGLKRINISLDSLRPERYKQITGGGELADTLRGIDAALMSSLIPLHINAVLMRGINDDEAEDFIRFAKENPVTVRFIELMPFLPGEKGGRTVPNSEILARHAELTPKEGYSTGQPSVDYTAEGFIGSVGFISPVTGKFCGACNRVRLLSDGTLKPCLGCEEEIKLRAMINDEVKLAETIKNAVYNKPTGHHFERGCTAGRSMKSIGG